MRPFGAIAMMCLATIWLMCLATLWRARAADPPAIAFDVAFQRNGRTLTLPAAPSQVAVYRNGLRMKACPAKLPPGASPPCDYTLAGAVVTFLSTPGAGDLLTIDTIR